MIPKRIIKRFLEARRDDHRWLKELNHKSIDKRLREIAPELRLHPKTGLHQKVAVYLGIRYRSFAFFYDMGTGKTLISLELLQYFWQIGMLRRALVFVTSDKAFPTWERQRNEYRINVPYCVLDSGTSEGKWKILRHFGDGIIFLHYPGTVAMVSGKPERSNSGRKQLLWDKVDRLLEDVDVVVYDESTKAANENSLTYQICWEASKQARHRFALAGRPFGRDPAPLWAQMNLVDHGETLGETKGLFYEAFFRQKTVNGHPKQVFRRNMTEKLSEVIQHTSMTYTADECIDLPPTRRIPVPIKLTREIREYMREVIAEAIAAKGNRRVMKNAFLRMRQLSSGFIGLKDDETGEKAEIEFEHSPKNEWLMDFLDTFPQNRKVLIFYQYTVSGRRIAREIEEQFGTKPVWLWSGTKNPAAEIERFMYDDDCWPCVVNNQVGAYSLDGLQVANYEVFFESPLSVIDREQAERRILRQGQLHSKCFYYDPVVLDTVDEKILEFHKEGRDLFDALLKNPSRVLASLLRH